MDGDMDPQQPGSAMPGDAPDSPMKPQNDPLASNNAAPLDADGLPINPDGGADAKSNIPPETLEDMKALWDVFDMDATNHVPIKELRTIMRALDIDLNPEELGEVKRQIDPE